MSKKKKIIIILLSILIVILVVLGIINNYEPFHFTNNIFFGKLSDKKIYEEEFNNIDTIYIDVDNAIINLINDDISTIKVEIYSKGKNIKLKSYNKKLSILTEEKSKCIFCTMNVINIYAPSSFKDYINISNDYGHTNLDNFESASVAITNKFGNINVGNINMLKATSSRGKITAGVINEASIRNGWGEVEISGVNRITVDSKLTNLTIKNIKKSADINIDLGDINIKKALIKEDSKIKNGYGKINIDEIIEDGGRLDK